MLGGGTMSWSRRSLELRRRSRARSVVGLVCALSSCSAQVLEDRPISPWVSADEPGGAFQGGAILAAMLLLAIMAGLIDTPALGGRRLRLALVGGALVFFAVGLGGLVFGQGFLTYPAAFAKPLILLIEAALIVSIALSLALFVAGPAERPRR